MKEKWKSLLMVTLTTSVSWLMMMSASYARVESIVNNASDYLINLARATALLSFVAALLMMKVGSPTAVRRTLFVVAASVGIVAARGIVSLFLGWA